jgi:S-DNA-T family DNA segregation ATPase FtsK/SpoIIIE
MIMFSKSMGRGNFYIVQIIAMITMLLSYLVPVVLHLQQRRQFRDAVKKRKQLYQNYLNENRDKLQAMKNELILTLHTNHPEPGFALQWAGERNPAIWSRIPSDPDYLKIRSGLGTIDSGFSVQVPKQDAIEKEPLVEDAKEMAEKFIHIANVPVLVDFQKYRVVGLVGSSEHTLPLARAFISHLALHHSPDEVKLSAFYSRQESNNWQWIRWLPHTWDDQRTSRFLFEEHRYQPQILENLLSFLQRRRWIGQSGGGGARALSPHFMFLVPELHLMEQDPIWPMLLNEGERVNTSCIVMAESRDELPKECQLVIECSGKDAVMRSTTVNTGDRHEREEALNMSFACDSVDLERAEKFARAMAPYQLKKGAADEIPGVLTLFHLFELQKIESLNVLAGWQGNRFPATLPARVGVKGGGKPVLLNIHDKIERKGHGPHGLMAGTTGSGKSEVIQTLIASLAVQYHPHDLAFMLIDYKGGGMSNTFAKLPHVIASITNLEEEGLIERSKISLKAELVRRQKLFVEAGNVQHIDEYYKTEHRLKHPLPHLMIVIDEFAQLKKDQPEFMSELVSIAAIGRTLGVHLLLATQKPGGVVDDKIWSNSRYKVCLRVQDEADSREMIKIPDAAYITNPGRGYLQVGTNELFETVQFAWSGAPYRPEDGMHSSDENVYAVGVDGIRQKLASMQDVLGDSSELANAVQTKKQLDVLIDWIAKQAEEADIRPLAGPWLPPLPTKLTLDDIDGEPMQQEGALKPVVGLVDHVSIQAQLPLTIDIEAGNWIIYGMPGTGKTTFLQTLLYSLSQTNTPDDIHAYILDFGRMFRDFGQLPHIGDVVQEEEEEKLARLFDALEAELAKRKTLFADAGLKSRRTYCLETGQALPAVLLVVDGYLNLKAKGEALHDRFENVVRTGASLGIYVAMTANRPSEMMEKVRSNFPNCVSFELSDPGDYHSVVGRLPKAPSGMPEGRGFVKGQVPPLPFHTAFALQADSESDRTKRMRERFQFLDQIWQGRTPESIATLPETVTFARVQEAASEAASSQLSIGLQISTLSAFRFRPEDGPFFMIAGRMESGKSALLAAIALELARTHSPDRMQLYLSDFRRNEQGLASVNKLAHVHGYAGEERGLEQMLGGIRQELERRVREGFDALTDPQVTLLMDDADITAKRISSMSAITSSLDYLLQNGRDNGIRVFIAGSTGDLQQLYDAWIKAFKMNQIGFLLGTTDMSDVQLFGIKLPFELSGKMLPPGEGLYIRRKYERIKTVYPFADGMEDLDRRIEDANARWGSAPPALNR